MTSAEAGEQWWFEVLLAKEPDYKWLLFKDAAGELEADVMLPNYMADRILQDHKAAAAAGLLLTALRELRDACFNGPLSTDADALAAWWEGFDGFVAETVIPAIAAAEEAMK